ncbi:MAG: hypothetical protein IH984_01865 [Planctomycetes bacterium]|nr:hypothetical protein [Planctomycetota bacterium]
MKPDSKKQTGKTKNDNEEPLPLKELDRALAALSKTPRDEVDCEERRKRQKRGRQSPTIENG